MNTYNGMHVSTEQYKKLKDFFTYFSEVKKQTREISEKVYSEEAKQTGKQVADKVKNVSFRLEDISFDERTQRIQLLKDFKSNVLYK